MIYLAMLAALLMGCLYETRRRRRRPKPPACDMCDGRFVRDDLTPISGDWWVCSPCLDRIMRDVC